MPMSKKERSRTLQRKVQRNPFTCKVFPDAIEIRKGRSLALAIRQGHDDIQPDEPGKQPILQIGLVLDDDDHCDPADFMVRVLAVEQASDQSSKEGYTLLIPEVDQLSTDWPTFTKLSRKKKTSWAVRIEDAAFETFKNVVEQFSKVDDPNPHLKNLILYVQEFEPQMRALVRRVMVDQILRRDPFIGEVFDHCADEILDSFVDDVHDF